MVIDVVVENTVPEVVVVALGEQIVGLVLMSAPIITIVGGVEIGVLGTIIVQVDPV